MSLIASRLRIARWEGEGVIMFSTVNCCLHALALATSLVAGHTNDQAVTRPQYARIESERPGIDAGDRQAVAGSGVPDTSPAPGTEIRVTMIDGAHQKGRFVALSAFEVAFTEHGRPVSLPIANIRKITITSHTIRNWGIGSALIALPIGGVNAVKENASVARQGLALAAIAGGIGTAIGALIDHSHSKSQIVYLANARTRQWKLLPVLSQQRVGLQFSAR